MVSGELLRTESGGFLVKLDGHEFDHRPSLEVVNHSPDGFAWGYFGSGPSQLALAILIHYAGKTFARENYMEYKIDVISQLDPNKGFKLTNDEIIAWIKDHEL